MISVKGLKYLQHEMWDAISTLNFILAQGQIAALYAKNSKAHLSALYALAGALPDAQGHVEIDDREYRLNAPELKKVAGFLPLGILHPPEFTVERALGYTIEIRRADMEPEARIELFEKIITHFDLDDIKSKKIQTLSPVDRMRVYVASECFDDFKYLLLDRPFTQLLKKDYAPFMTFLRDKVFSLQPESAIIMALSYPALADQLNLDKTFEIM